MNRLRYLVVLIAVAMVVTGASFLGGPSATERAGWRADLIEMETGIAAGFANFEWRIAQRRLDLPAIHRAADSAIADARSERAARKVLRGVVASFDDGHLQLDGEPNPAVATVMRWLGQGDDAGTIPAATGAGSACRRMGFSNRSQGSDVALAALDGFEEVEGGPFPAGVLTLEGSRRVGVVRIAHFGEDGYRAACEAEWEETVARDTVACDDECQGRVHSGVSARLLAALDSTLGRISARGATALLVDVTGNGGGSNLADAIARQLTPRPLRGARAASIRHPHTVSRLRWADSAIAADLARGDITPAHRGLLAAARASVDSALRRADPTCDLAGSWTGRREDCSLLYRSLFATGVLEYAPPGALAGLASAGVLFDPSGYPYREGAFAGALFLLVDGGSASATEQFAALLSDNGAALVIGEQTWGVGCGYTWGGVRMVLPNTRLTLRLPDCARYRASGANEAEGITPDVPAGWIKGDDAATRAEKVRSQLDRLVPRATLSMRGDGG